MMIKARLFYWMAMLNVSLSIVVVTHKLHHHDVKAPSYSPNTDVTNNGEASTNTKTRPKGRNNNMIFSVICMCTFASYNNQSSSMKEEKKFI
jgi:hypothetical protein